MQLQVSWTPPHSPIACPGGENMYDYLTKSLGPLIVETQECMFGLKIFTCDLLIPGFETTHNYAVCLKRLFDKSCL